MLKKYISPYIPHFNLTFFSSSSKLKVQAWNDEEGVSTESDENLVEQWHSDLLGIGDNEPCTCIIHSCLTSVFPPVQSRWLRNNEAGIYLNEFSSTISDLKA